MINVMHPLKRPLMRLVPCLVLAAAGCGDGDSEPVPVPSASVRMATAVAGQLAPLAQAYGLAGATPAHTRVVVMPFEGAIAAVEVHVGDAVSAGQTLMSVAPTPATAATAAQARSAVHFAEEDLKRVQRLHADLLATNEQVASAQKAVADAQSAFAALSRAGADLGQAPLRAPFAGIVTSLAATPGDRPAMGSVLATVASPSDVIVQLGLEPGDAAQLAPGAAVRLSYPEGQGPENPRAIDTRLSTVGRALDPATRLVNAVAPLPGPAAAAITLGMTLQAQIELPAQRGVLVPRAALLEDAQGPFVYTVAGGKAHRQAVTLGAETGESALTTAGLSAGVRVVVGNNAGLADGIAVTDADKAGTESAP